MNNESMTAIEIVGMILSILAIFNLVLLVSIQFNSKLLSKKFKRTYPPAGILYAMCHLTFQIAFSQGLFTGMGG